MIRKAILFLFALVLIAGMAAGQESFGETFYDQYAPEYVGIFPNPELFLEIPEDAVTNKPLQVFGVQPLIGSYFETAFEPKEFMLDFNGERIPAANIVKEKISETRSAFLYTPVLPLTPGVEYLIEIEGIDALDNPFSRTQLIVFLGVPTTDIAVTQKGYDKIQEVLDALGYDYTVLSPSELVSEDVTSRFKTILINCADLSFSKKAKDNLKNFVETGGSLYVSDWGYEYLQESFPQSITFIDRVGIEETVNATVLDKGIISYLNEDLIKVFYDIGEWIPIAGVGNQTVIHVDNNVHYHEIPFDWENSSNADFEIFEKSAPLHINVPTVVSFAEQEGFVVYTSFHEAAQTTETQKLMEYLVLLPVTSTLAKQLREGLTEQGIIVFDDYRTVLSQGQRKEFVFNVQENEVIVVQAGWEGKAEITISVLSQNNTLLSEESFSNSPAELQFESTQEETVHIFLEGSVLSEKNKPFVVFIGERSGSAAERLSSDAEVKKNPPRELTEVSTENNDVLLIGGIFILIIGAGIVVLVILKKKPPAA